MPQVTHFPSVYLDSVTCKTKVETTRYRN